MKATTLALVLGCLATVGASAAENWPTKVVKVIVPFAPGSTPDIVARIVAEKMQQKLGKPFIVENKPGASGNIGTGAVAKAAPDGHTIGVSIGGPLALNTLLFQSMPYDPFKELAPVTLLASQPSVLVVSNKLNVKTFAELRELLRASPNKYSYASIGHGSLSHLAMEMLATKAGAQMVHAPYPGSGQAMLAVMSGEVDMACLPAIAAMPRVSAGRAVALAVTTAERSALMPDVPTLKEVSGLDIEADAWIGLIAPAKTPDAVVSKLHREVQEIMESADVKEKLHNQFMVPNPIAPEDFAKHIGAELARWEPVIKANNIRLD